MLRATWILFLAHLRRTALSRRALLCLALVLIPVGVAFLISRVAPEDAEVPAAAIGYLLVVQTIVPIIGIILGAAVVSEEIEDRTISYLLARPIPRPAILLGRWLATVLVIGVLLAASSWVVVTLLASVTAGDPEHAVPAGFRTRLVLVVIAGGYAYSAVSAALGAWLKRPVLIGLGYTFAVEGFFANLPGSNQSLTIQYYLKSFLMADEPALIERYSGWLVRTELAAPFEAARTLLVVGVVALALGSWILSRRQFVLPA